MLLRFYIYNLVRKNFVKLKVVCNHRDLRFDENKCGVVFEVPHGVSVKLIGGINVFALHSVSNSKIWVFAFRMVDEDESQVVKLMKCAVIDCTLPIFSMHISFGYLVLGEANGVRVFQLRLLLKGRVKRDKRLNGRVNLNGGMEKDVCKLEAKKVSYLQNGFVRSEDELNGHSEGQLGVKSQNHSDSGEFCVILILFPLLTIIDPDF